MSSTTVFKAKVKLDGQDGYTSLRQVNGSATFRDETAARRAIERMSKRSMVGGRAVIYPADIDATPDMPEFPWDRAITVMI